MKRSNHSQIPITLRGARYESIKEAVEKTGLSRYLVKKECEYLNPHDRVKFRNSGAKPRVPDVLPDRDAVMGAYTGNIRESAKTLGVTERVFRDLLKKYGIPVISRSESKIRRSDASKPPREELASMYEGSSVQEVMDHYGIGYPKLMRWLRSYGIPRKKRGATASVKHAQRHRGIRPSYDELLGQYANHTIHDLSLIYGVDKHVVSSWLSEYSISMVGNMSREENHLFEYCRSLDPTFSQNDRSIIAPKEIDIISHTHRLGIEYCGLYWHSEGVGRGKWYHHEKYAQCHRMGYKLLTVFESDDVSKIKALIRSVVGANPRIYARKTRISPVPRTVANQFHRDHHLSGAIGGRVHLGLYRGDELVMVGSFGPSRHNRMYEWECYRLTSHSDYSVVGGASKIFSHFFRDWKVRSCITYADLRFGDGSVYTHCGMERVQDTHPNYFYFKNNELALWSRVKFQKHKQKDLLERYDLTLTEYQNMVNNGYHRIWDCGNAAYVYVATQ